MTHDVAKRRVAPRSTPTQRRTARPTAGPAIGNAALAQVAARSGATLQRDIAGDVDAGWEVLKRQRAYNNYVLGKLGPYTTKINSFRPDRRLPGEADDARTRKVVGERLAKGFRHWNENYYNKSQGYLWEMDAATEATIALPHTGQVHKVGILGHDDRTQPDLSVEDYEIAAARPNAAPQLVLPLKQVDALAVELKANTKGGTENAHVLALHGAHQLRKRQDAGYKALKLVMHIDGSDNVWPFTPREAEHQRTARGHRWAEAAAWNDRLAKRAGELRRTAGLGVPFTIELWYQGLLAATVTILGDPRAAAAQREAIMPFAVPPDDDDMKSNDDS
ncbi:MAG: hypothetical protein JWQ20_4097 [Conexibacter sp.]|nr:hypothetical protein [Solirubrobacterales bacterium]MCW3004799.1 hypothetical protein [Conexibacter sp.]